MLEVVRYVSRIAVFLVCVCASAACRSGQSPPATEFRTAFAKISLNRLAGNPAPIVNLGLRPGDNRLGKVPFENGWEATRCRWQTPRTIDVPAKIPNPKSVFLLIQAGWGMKSSFGADWGRITAELSNGSRYETKLTLGDNIRDWARREPEAVTTFTSPDLQPVWSGFAGGKAGGIDMLTIVCRPFRPACCCNGWWSRAATPGASMCLP